MSTAIPKRTPLVMPSAAPTRKVVAGTASGIVVGTALANLLVWAIQTFAHITIEPAVALAIGTLMASASSFVASYYTPPHPSEIPIPAPSQP